ncbi:hypothetical protein WAK64_16470 [Bacillus spongiae]|uniref:YtzI protein n=1 Tax=Bacillus spongiae TaxID=2683610 RepID=A0ABU8HHP4_9BACI
MTYYWVVTVGMLMVLFLIGWTFFYFLRQTLNSDESKRIDPLPKSNKENPPI